MNSRAARDVAIVTGDFVKTGGMDRANYALADFLSRSGVRVELVAHRVASDLSKAPGVTFTQVPKPLRSYILGEPLLDFAGRQAARNVCRRGGVAIVNGGICLSGPVNWVHYVHAAYRPPPSFDRRGAVRFWHGRRHRSREKTALGLAGLVITNSKATRRIVVEELGVSPERAVAVYYGIDAERFTETSETEAVEARLRFGWSERPTVGFVGALGDRRKGFDTLFEAWRLLCRDTSWDVDLVAVGAGAEVESWRERASQAKLDERIRLLGFRTDVPEILRACDAFVAPTRYEAFGLGVAEALAVGLPAFVSASAGVAELYPETTRHLLLDDPESPAELAQKLRAWRSATDRERVVVSELARRVRARTWDHMAAEIAELTATIAS